MMFWTCICFLLSGYLSISQEILNEFFKNLEKIGKKSGKIVEIIDMNWKALEMILSTDNAIVNVFIMFIMFQNFYYWKHFLDEKKYKKIWIKYEIKRQMFTGVGIFYFGDV